MISRSWPGRELDTGVRYLQEERQAREKRFRDTVLQDRRRRAKTRIWLGPR